MAPEHSDGLDDYDVPSRTVAASETHSQRLRRILVYAGTRSASTSEGSTERLGTVLTAAGRRSGRLASSTATGGDITSEDAETQAIVLHNLQVERTVVERLRAALPPPTGDDFPETGGEALPGAEYEVDYVEPLALDATTVTINDDSGVVGDTQGTVEGAPTLKVLGLAAGIPDMPRMCINHERCGHAQAITMCVDPAYCCDECAYTNGQEHAEHCYADQITESHGPGSAGMERKRSELAGSSHEWSWLSLLRP